MEYSSPAVYSTSLIMLHNVYQALHHCFFYAVHLSIIRIGLRFHKKEYTSFLNKSNLILCSLPLHCVHRKNI